MPSCPRPGAEAGKGLSPATVRRVHVTAHKALRDAVRWGKLARNPADLADPPQERRPEMHVWSAEQARAFLAHVKGDRLSALYLLALTTGMRRGELVGLRWEDVDLDAPRLAIRQTIVAVGTRRSSPPRRHRRVAASSRSIRPRWSRSVPTAWPSSRSGWRGVRHTSTRARVHPGGRSPDPPAGAVCRLRAPRPRLGPTQASRSTGCATPTRPLLSAAASTPGSWPIAWATRRPRLRRTCNQHVLPEMDDRAARKVAGLILGSDPANRDFFPSGSRPFSMSVIRTRRRRRITRGRCLVAGRCLVPGVSSGLSWGFASSSGTLDTLPRWYGARRSPSARW